MDKRFQHLFIFEMANNHQGSVEHGKVIIDAMAEITKKRKTNAAVKFQFRDLDTFVHPDFRDRKDVKHISRFLSTRLSVKQFGELVMHTKKKDLLAIATPFDEASVQTCVDLKIDIIKVASCSVTDWPLLEAVAAAKKPVIVSTGGTMLSDIDKVVSFFTHKGATFALLHCVGVYPTPPQLLHLGIISRLIRRYPGIPIGYSGHEGPDELQPVTIAVSKGAMILERHIGVETKDTQLNVYSMNPTQTDAWVQAAQTAWAMIGVEEKMISGDEKTSLESLMRGTYAKKSIKKGQTITRDDVYFAVPLQEGQLTSGAFGSYRAVFTASRDYGANEPIAEIHAPHPLRLVREAVHKATGMLNEANISIGNDCTIELSHHYGMDRFEEIGATIINMINREYCKKLIIVFPAQKHPVHRHEKKEETFEMLAGDLRVKLDDEIIDLKPGDRLLIKRNTWHSFSSQNGAIFEEISTTHYRDDSHYEDTAISALDPLQRKTILEPQEGG